MGSLRFLLALSVACGHFGVPLGFPTSDVAVQSFFVISGFYMALVLFCHFLFGWLVMPSTYFAVSSALLLTLATSVAIYHLLDKPIDLWRQNRLRKAERTLEAGQLLASV